jgi:Zn-dependent peptidase ImmA (M78 family)
MRILSSHVRAAISLAKKYTQSVGAHELPIDISLIARQLGVARIEPKKMIADGYLGKAADGNLVIRHRHDVSRERARFTIAHEIGHIILARVQGADVTDPAFRLAGGSNAEEAVVNRIAAELLMPERLLRNVLRSRQGSWDLVWQIRRRFSVSTMAVLLRILELPGVPSIFIRIGNLDSEDELRCECRTSQSPQLTFQQRVDKQAARIVGDAANDAPTPLRVFFGDSEATIPMASCVIRNRGITACWSIGWQVFA